MKALLVFAAVVGIGYLGFTGRLDPLISHLTDPDGAKAKNAQQRAKNSEQTRQAESLEDAAMKDSFKGL